MSRSFLNPSAKNQLSEYGKKRMVEIGEEALKKWREDTLKKQQDTLLEIEQNIEEIANKLIVYFKIPVFKEEIAKIANSYITFLSSMDIENRASVNKIDPLLKELIDEFIKFNQKQMGEEFVSIYLVGSCGRGEYVPGSSDINIYFITSSNKYDSFSNENIMPNINVVFLSKDEFLSEEHKKDRFICWSDGVLLWGEEFKFDSKEFPKAGGLLCLLLNRGVIEKLEEIKQKVSLLHNPSDEELRRFSLKLSKIMLDFDFGVAMTNKPFYTASRKEKINYIKELWLEHNRTTTLENIYYNGVIKQDDFPWLIDTYLERGKENYQKLLDVENRAKEEKA